MSQSIGPSTEFVTAGLHGSGPRPSIMGTAQDGWFTADGVLRVLVTGAAVTILVMLAALLVVLANAAMPTIKAYGTSFLTTTEWRPNALEQPVRDEAGSIVYDEDGEMVYETVPAVFGAAPVIYGTIVSSLIALVLAIPLSLGAALFLVRISPRTPRSAAAVVYFIGLTMVVLGLWSAIAYFARSSAVHSLRWPVALIGGGLLTWMAVRAVPKLTEPVSFLIEFLAAIPSIAYGLWGLYVLAPFLQGGVEVWGWMNWLTDVPVLKTLVSVVPNWDTPDVNDTKVVFVGLEPLLKHWLYGVPGFGWMFTHNGREVALTGRDMFCGGMILGIMILPIITAVSRDVLRAVPRAQIEGTLALGATWWQSCWEMLRYSRSGLFGAIMLGLARAAGETMAVTMVIGNNNQIAASIFAPAQSMASLLANEFAEANDEMHRSALIEVALILLIMSLAFNVVARWFVVGGGSRTAQAH